MQIKENNGITSKYQIVLKQPKTTKYYQILPKTNKLYI